MDASSDVVKPGEGVAILCLLAVIEDLVDADDSAALRHRACYDGARPNSHCLADDNVTEHGGARTENDAVADGWVALGAVHRLACGTERHLVQHVYVAANDGGPPDYDARGVVNHDARPDLGSRLRPDRLQPEGGEPVCGPVAHPERMGDVVKADRMEALEEEQRLQHAIGRRIDADDLVQVTDKAAK
eukprot:scaffold22545_cov126-Isochrysis_galbana.AAC.10